MADVQLDPAVFQAWFTSVAAYQRAAYAGLCESEVDPQERHADRPESRYGSAAATRTGGRRRLRVVDAA